jgi:hypothetical protein
MGESGLPKAYEKFSFEKSADQMELLYKHVCGTAERKQ